MTENKDFYLHIIPLVIMLTVYQLFYAGNSLETIKIRWIFLISVSIAALYILIRSKMVICNNCTLPLVLFIIFASISAIFSMHSWESLIGGTHRFTGLLSYLCFALLFLLSYNVAVLHSEKRIENIIDVWLMSTSVIAFIGIMQYIGHQILPYGEHVIKFSNSYSTLGNSNHFGTNMLMAFPFAGHRFLVKPNISAVIIFILIYGSLLTSLCRGAYLGLALGIILLLFLYPLKKYMLSLMVIMLLVTFIVMPINNWMLISEFITFDNQIKMALVGENNLGSGRLLIWKEGFKVLPDSIIIGTGPDTFQYISQNVFEERWSKDYQVKAHNIYLEIWVTMGLTALLSYLWFIKRCVSNTNLNKPIEVTFYIMVLTYLLQGMFLVDVISVYPLFWILLGFYAGSKVIYHNKELLISHH